MDAFFGEIRIFGFNFPPQNWAQCNGATLGLLQYQVLYSVIGVQFGGDGVNNFKLPNLMGSAVCQAGQGTGLSYRIFGKTFGASSVTLNETQMPSHNHTMNAVQATTAQLTNMPTAASYMARTNGQLNYTNTDTYDTTLSDYAVAPWAGNGQAHENRQPYLAMNFCICTYGDYPIRA